MGNQRPDLLVEESSIFAPVRLPESKDLSTEELDDILDNSLDIDIFDEDSEDEGNGNDVHNIN